MRMIVKMMVAAAALLALTVGLIASGEVSAEHAIGDDPADFSNISWMMVCTVLVMIMSPGIALFYGGMLRKQSMTATMTQTMIAMAVMGIMWVLVGFSFAFASGNDVIGGFDYVLLHNIGFDTIGMTNDTIPDMEFMLFQMTFAMLTGAIVLGACAERMRFPVVVAFLAVWSILVYAPMAHMVWGGGLMENLPFGLSTLDFAGGTVVHICAGASGLALVAFLGRRSEKVSVRSHSVPMTFIGFLLLWMGWMGFNGGSGLAADGTAINALSTSVIASLFGMAAWAVVQYLQAGRVGALGLIAGAVAGLVAITPGAGYVSASDSIIIGAVGGAICYYGVILMRRSGFDDALDVMGIHGIGGIWGAIATGIFAYADLGGLIGSGDWHLLVGQIVAVLFTLAFCFAVSYAIIWVISKLMKGSRVSESEEMVGQDLVEHGEPAYVMRGGRDEDGNSDVPPGEAPGGQGCAVGDPGPRDDDNPRHRPRGADGDNLHEQGRFVQGGRAGEGEGGDSGGGRRSGGPGHRRDPGRRLYQQPGGREDLRPAHREIDKDKEPRRPMPLSPRSGEGAPLSH